MECLSLLSCGIFFTLFLQHKVLNRRLRPLGDGAFHFMCVDFFKQEGALFLRRYMSKDPWFVTHFLSSCLARECCLATFSWESVTGSVLRPALCRVCQLWPWSFIPNPQPLGYHSVSFLTYIVHFFSSCFSSRYVQTYLTLAFGTGINEGTFETWSFTRLLNRYTNLVSSTFKN